LWTENKNELMVIVGDPGSGKSYSALSLAERIDPTFNVDRVVFKPEEFLDVLDKCSRGNVVIFDEAGVGIPSREWQTIQNKLLSYVLQTFRYKNLCVIFTTPNMSYIDKQVRLLVHHSVVAKAIFLEINAVQCYFYVRDHNPLTDIPTFEPLKLANNGTLYNVNPVYIPHPSEELAKEYERKSKMFKKEVEVEAREKIQQIREGKIDQKLDGRQVRRLKNQADALKNLVIYLMKQGYKASEICSMMGITQQTFQGWKKEWNLKEALSITT